MVWFRDLSKFMLFWLILQSIRCILVFSLVLITCGCWIIEPPHKLEGQWGNDYTYLSWEDFRGIGSSLVGNSLTSSIEKKHLEIRRNSSHPFWAVKFGEHKSGVRNKKPSTWGSSQPRDSPKMQNLSGIPNPPVHNLRWATKKKKKHYDIPWYILGCPWKLVTS